MTSSILPFSSMNIFSNTAMAQEDGYYDNKYDDYVYNDYSDQEKKYECQKGPFEGFFVSSPEFCKSKVIPDRDRDGGNTTPSNPDTDGDGVNDNVDNCPTTQNSDQADQDGDRIGNVCDPDDDNDGINDNVDNCSLLANTNQTDSDNDGIGDACDSTPNTPNPDTDGDGVNDNVDNCPTTSNPEQVDRPDNDGIGNVCDPDDDNDGINDNVDNCPELANTNQTDTDNDGIGNVCDPDTTNPGVQPLAFSDLGYETGDVISGWEWGKSQAADLNSPSSRLNTVDKSSETPLSPDPQGNRILKTTVFPNDVARDSKNPIATVGTRAEVVHTNPFQSGTENPLEDPFYENGDEMWFHWYTLFPNNLKVDKRFQIWTQFHQFNDASFCPDPPNPNCPAVPITFNIINRTQLATPQDPNAGLLWQLNIIEKNSITSNTNYFTTLYETKAILGGWYEFLFHVKWAKCGNDINSGNGTCTNQNNGFVELWVKEPTDPVSNDPTKDVPKIIHYTMDIDGINYAKQGLYTGSGGTTSQTVYHDGMEVAKCPSTHPFYHPNIRQCFTTEPYT